MTSVKAKREFWIVDGTSKTYDLRVEIKRAGGFFVKEHKYWCIVDPSDELMKIFKNYGLRFQFRRHIQ